ncbi:MAG TPA: hemerythrin domain-containing protein [Bryobacteraceae bacterium]|nr:hemerythrin domain-containing protein [Bryobacteraceae bacterium]
MATSTLINEFHSDHTKVVQALFDVRNAIEQRDPARLRAVLAEADRLVGPHFEFEERYLYPSLKGFLGEGRLQRLLVEHDGVFRAVAALAELSSKPAWDANDARAAESYLDLIWEHPVTCDGLSLYIERLPAEQQESLLERMQEMRRKATTLLEYRKQRAS